MFAPRHRSQTCHGLPVLRSPDILACMKRTTVTLPDDLDMRLRHEAARRNMTVSELTREAIECHVAGRGPVLNTAGAGRCGRDDISERIEEILAAEVAP